MKTILLTSSPYFKVLIIGSVIFSSMAFRNPFVAQYEPKNVQWTDTIPNSDINLNIDVSKILIEVDKALQSINVEKILADVQESLKKIDLEKMQIQIEQSIRQ